MPRRLFGLVGARRTRLGPPAVEYVVLVVAIALILVVGAWVLGQTINELITESPPRTTSARR